MAQIRIVTNGPEETENAGYNAGLELQGRALILLEGPLGSGKTTFVKGFARALGVDPDKVTSPSFSLIHDHGLFVHADLYRLQDATLQDLAEIGLLDLIREERPLLVEWPVEALVLLEKPSLTVTFLREGSEKSRTILLCGIIEP